VPWRAGAVKKFEGISIPVLETIYHFF